ncbi:hypothetical protein M3D75_03455 [Microbacterium enclense]|uniref:hypothetical protein n=1 Tax=Microbacterium enclense TaxID=993073 RepID=UPI0021A6AB4E|nr:hypothetical protein [Microbacterium enclense]MCT2085165.1 hypothetical protein [Microbacterium enclense]
MPNPGDYEQLGDITAPFQLTKKHHRAQVDRARMVDSMRCEVPSLTFDEYRAGVPCPGCGRPYIDVDRWERPGTMHMTDSERARYDKEEAAYLALHRECRSSRHSVSGSLTTHCMKCCSPPPLSPTQIESLAALLSRKTPPHELTVWRLRLYCGHVVERHAHRSHTTVHGAFTGSVSCPECGLHPATIIDAVALGPLEEPPAPPTPTRNASAHRTRAQLEKRVQELETELKALREP